MKARLVKLLAIVVVAGVLGTPVAGMAETIKADLDGYQVVSTQSTLGTGTFRAKLDRVNHVIEYELTYQDLEGDILQSHIHFGRPGTNGGIVTFLCTNLNNDPSRPADPTTCVGTRAGTVKGVVRPENIVFLPFPNVFPPTQLIEPGEFDEVVRAIDAGAAYVVVHTKAQPPGELRGNIPGKGRGAR